MQRIETISQFHHHLGLPNPRHPLISVLDIASVPPMRRSSPVTMLLNFYAISVKRMQNVKVKYGQQPFDFNEGVMSFMAPRQVITMAVNDPQEAVNNSGWAVYVHPDFMWNTHLAGTIRKYDFWDYALHEALFLSAAEEDTMTAIIGNIDRETKNSIDRFSKPIVISQIETLLNYADRFYQRQFVTRERLNHQILDRLDRLLNDYLTGEEVIDNGVPTVQYVADQLHLSPGYLSNVLRTLTGQNTQQHIHDRLIAHASERLSTTDLPVSEIAYALGFRHLPSFSKLFKAKTRLSPLQFRKSFN